MNDAVGSTNENRLLDDEVSELVLGDENSAETRKVPGTIETVSNEMHFAPIFLTSSSQVDHNEITALVDDRKFESYEGAKGSGTFNRGSKLIN